MRSPACSAEAISRRRHYVAAAPTATPMALSAIHAHQVGLCVSRPAASKVVPREGFMARTWAFWSSLPTRVERAKASTSSLCGQDSYQHSSKVPIAGTGGESRVGVAGTTPVVFVPRVGACDFGLPVCEGEKGSLRCAEVLGYLLGEQNACRISRCRPQERGDSGRDLVQG